MTNTRLRYSCVRTAAPLLLMVVGNAACKTSAPDAPPPPQVGVSRPVVREVVEWDEYTARLEAVDSVEVRPRVSGYLESVHFKDGAMVKKGDVLFIIDPRPYVAVLRRAEADLAVAKARLDLAETRAQRAERLLGKNAISKEEADTRTAEARQASASVAAAVAAVETARLDVDFTRIEAPVSGRAGRKLITEGNLISGGSGSQGTLLTTIVSLDPIYAYFEADERSYLKYVHLAQAGLRPSSRDVPNPVQIGFGDEQGFPHEGMMNFVDNRLDPDTGTMTARAVLSNPDLLYSPGLFARLRLIGGSPYRAVMISDDAVLHDQSQTFVFVVDGDSKAVYRKITLGPLIDGLRVVREGLGADDRVVVRGTQRIRPDIVVSVIEDGATPPSANPTPAATGSKASS